MNLFLRKILLSLAFTPALINSYAQVNISPDYILRKGENIADKVSKNMQLRQEINKTSCFVGESIIATYKLYTRLKSESKLTGNPAFNGFSVIEMTSSDMTICSRQMLQGREYNVYTIRKAQLYPLQPGTIDLETAELENNISFIRDGYVFRPDEANRLFDDAAGTMIAHEGIINQTVSLKSKPISILVKPLPEANKPSSFTGAVGDFFIEAHLQKSSFSLNESGKLFVKISGSGNLQLLTAPVLVWPAGIESFDPKVSEVLNKMSVPVKGNKLFEYGFSVNRAGNYSLPAIQFSYFDPGTARYKTIKTDPISFLVTHAATHAQAAIPAATKQNVSGINKIFSNRWWIIEFMAIVMITGLIIWVRHDKRSAAKKELIEKENNVDKIKLNSILETSALNQQNPLLKTEECMYQDNCEAFYSLLNMELKNYLAQKFQVGTAEVTIKSITVIMDKKGISNDTVLQLQQLLQEIEWMLYTPFERNEKMNEFYSNAQDIIQMINTYDVRHL